MTNLSTPGATDVHHSDGSQSAFSWSRDLPPFTPHQCHVPGYPFRTELQTVEQARVISAHLLIGRDFLSRRVVGFGPHNRIDVAK